MTITVYELGGLEDFRYCPFCWRTLMAVKHKGIESFDRVPVFYRDRSPIDFTGQGKVPVLVDGDRWVNDSWDIADYLEDTYADRPALFGGDVGRGGAQFISAWTPCGRHSPNNRSLAESCPGMPTTSCSGSFNGPAASVRSS